MARKTSEKTKKKLPAQNLHSLPVYSDTSYKGLEICLLILLFAFGLYHSILYFGHQIVPNSDFMGFVETGRKLLSFQAPSSFKRAPVLGMLQVCLSRVVGGQHPDLTAGWLLNAILHPFNVVLLYLIGKRIIGKASVWVAIIAIINPWVIQLLTEPIAETTLLFFVSLTFYLMFRRSNWCYVFASITTMVRYEGAVLILAAFIMDCIYEESWRKRIWALVFSALACVPLMLWMLGTVLSFRQQGATYYLKELGHAGTFGQSLIRYLNIIWQSGFYPLFIPSPSASKETAQALLNLNKAVVACAFAFGAFYGLLKKQWKILGLLIFLVPYFFIHVVHSVVLPRYCTTVNWIVLLICVFGLQSLWSLIDKGGRVPKQVRVLLQVIVLAAAGVWFVQLIPYLPKIAFISRHSVSMPYVAMAAIAGIYVLQRIFYRARFAWQGLVISVLMCLMVVSNQLLLVRVLGNGQRDVEFKLLADWYLANAKPGEKLATTMSSIVGIFAPQYRECFVHTSGIKADNPRDFVQACYERDITYVAWDSRLGLVKDDRYYQLWHLENIAALALPRNIGPYEFIKQIKVSERRFINIFRLRKPSSAAFSDSQTQRFLDSPRHSS